MEEDKRTLIHPLVGHSVTFLQTGDQTSGDLLQVAYAVQRPEQGPAPIVPRHIHLRTRERFQVLEGTLGVLLDGKKHLLAAGEYVTILPGMPHTFWNAGQGTVRFLTDIRPAGGFQSYWETVFGLAEDGRVGENGLPGLLQLAVLAPYADSYSADMPLPLARALIAVLGAAGRLRGYRAVYPQYSHPAVA
jgi:mannose-6-phosphate isomerase-like protein (cupin superfamily)